MRVCFHDDGIISQFEGYERLAELDWLDYQERYGDIQSLDRILEAEGDSTNRYKVSKQADVLMIFYLLSSAEVQDIFDRLDYPFDPPTDFRRNIEYYLARTSHGSTLSRIVHSWVLARLDRRRSWELFLQALNSDIADIQGGTTHEGIHLGSMAGTLDLVQRVLWWRRAAGRCPVDRPRASRRASGPPIPHPLPGQSDRHPHHTRSIVRQRSPLNRSTDPSRFRRGRREARRRSHEGVVSCHRAG